MDRRSPDGAPKRAEIDAYEAHWSAGVRDSEGWMEDGLMSGVFARMVPGNREKNPSMSALKIPEGCGTFASDHKASGMEERGGQLK